MSSTLKRKGFTIVEVLVAITIATAAVILGSAALAAGLDARVANISRAKAAVRASAVREQITMWLESSHTPGMSDNSRFVLRDLDADGVGDELTFVTLNAEPIAEGEARISLRWQAAQGTQRIIAVVTAVGRANVEADTVLISDWVSKLSIQVLPDTLGEWVGQWSSAVMLPAAITLRLSSANTDSLSTIAETPIVVTLKKSQ